MEAFVIRIWSPAESALPKGARLFRLRGFVEHVGTGRSSAFAGLHELEGLILAGLHDATRKGDANPSSALPDPRQLGGSG